MSIQDKLKRVVARTLELADGVKSIAGGLLIAASYLVRLKNPALADAMFKAGTALMTIGGFDKLAKWSSHKPVFDGPLIQATIEKTKNITKTVLPSQKPQYPEDKNPQ